MTAIQQQTVPALRFPEFSGDWNTDHLKNYIFRVGVPVSIEPEKLYREIGIRSHGKGLFHKEPVTGKSLGNKKVFKVHIPAFVVNIVFAWEHAIAVTSDNEDGFIASHRFPMFVPVVSKSTLPFVRYFFLRKYGKHLLGLASPGGAGRNKTLGQKNFAKLKVIFPEVDEQQKIASFLTSVDTKIEQLGKKKVLLEQYKKGMMQKIFSQELRFKDEHGNDFPDWEKKRLEDVLDYKQPTAYLVKNKEYNDNYETPVLTAGKTFLLGYTQEKKGLFEDDLPTIIFDDFTTAFKYVNFPFKAKSSAMKMLITKSEDINMKFVYEAMRRIRFPLGNHKRYWISEYKREKIAYPDPKEQQKIADFFSSIDKKIALIATELKQTQTFKKGLLQQMFI